MFPIKEPFITNKVCLDEWKDHWKPDPSITSPLPENAIFSLIPIDAGARKAVLLNKDHAAKIQHVPGSQLIGIPVSDTTKGNHGYLMSIGRSAANAISVPNAPQLSLRHVEFEMNFQTKMLLIRDVSSKCYTYVGKEATDEKGHACINESKYPITMECRKTVLWPGSNDVIGLGTTKRKICTWRMYWHVKVWPPLDTPRVSEVPFNRSLAATRSFSEDPQESIARAELVKNPKPPKKTFLRLNQLGKGDYGSVFAAINMSSGDYVAIKVQLDENRMREQAKREHMSLAQEKDLRDWLKRGFKAEISAYAYLAHPNIVKFHGWWQFNDRVELYLDLKSGAAENLKKPGRVPENRKRGVAFDLLKDIAKALEYMHARGFIHRDLWPENILYEETKLSLSGYRFLVGDMGHCLHQSSDISHGTQWNVAPELWEPATSETPHNSQSDIWGLFVTVVDMMYPNQVGGIPTREGARIVRRVIEARNTFPEVQDFYEMANLAPMKRPTAAEVVKLTQQPGARERFCKRAATIWHPGSHPPGPSHPHGPGHPYGPGHHKPKPKN